MMFYVCTIFVVPFVILRNASINNQIFGVTMNLHYTEDKNFIV